MRSRVIGFVSSLVFTLIAFTIFFRPEFFHLGTTMNIAVVFVLAILQASAQSIFFLNVLSEKGPRWNLLIFASTISIVVIIIFFSIWIMNHLNYNMQYMQ